ncbi:MAG: branched-chain amino acid ABC transporter permease [Lachnospiraceae bacterium]|nr:branched-chain amino acid ABC transporter permease [Lachnospiraceae bacterium]
MKLTKQTKKDLVTYLMVILFYVIMQILDKAGILSFHIKGLLVPLCYYAIAAVALNLVVGILGDLSLGHAGFMCVGAFSASLFSVAVKETGMPSGLRFLIALVIGTLVAALFGFLIGIPVLRLNGDYLAIVTLAFGEIIKNILAAIYFGYDEDGLHIAFKSFQLNGEGKMLINGAMGIQGTPTDSTFTISVVILLLALFVIQNIINSRTGRAVMSIRDNRIAAEAVGINVTKYKMLAFTISAAIAGTAGVLFSHNTTTLTAASNYFGYNVSILILVYVVLGGIGNIRGSVIATAVLYILPEMLRGLNNYRMLIYSVVLIAIMLINWAPKAIAFRERYGIKAFLEKKRENSKAYGKGGV